MSNITSVRSSEIKPKNNNDYKCAPGTNFEAGSCAKLAVLIEYANAYNSSNNNKIKMYPEMECLNPKKYKKYLVREIQNKLKDVCDDQKCWMEQSFVNKMKETAREEFTKHTLRPEGPYGTFEWLSTINIDDSMAQYEQKYSEFKFLGAVPMDFDEIEHLGIKNLDYGKLIKEGKSKIGVIFNLDEHWQPGSHWVGMFSDLKKGSVYYFDSYGVLPEPRVRKLMRRIARFCQVGLGINNITVEHNKIRHQYENSECGVYSMNFILRMLRGDTFEQICESKVPDKKINKCRKIYFNK